LFNNCCGAIEVSIPRKGHLTQSNPIYSTCPISPYNLGIAATAPDKPHILLVSLDINFPFDQLYQRLLGKLNNIAAIDQAKWFLSPTVASQSIMLVMRNFLATFAVVVDRLVLIGNFSSTTRPKHQDNLLQEKA
jgi:hypothetical protein